jgi:hypothetical protein
MFVSILFLSWTMLIPEICSTGELDLTMLRQICRRGWMNIVLQGTLLSPSPKQDIPQSESDHVAFDKSRQSHISPLAEAQHNLKGCHVPNALYDLILSHINNLRGRASQPPLRHYTKVPHPPNTLVLPSVAMSIHHFTQISHILNI